MDHYRVVARTIWNVGFWSQADLQNWDSRDHFREIRTLLFNALVMSRLNETDEVGTDLGNLLDRTLQVTPLDSVTVPIMIQRPREEGQAGYWDDPVRDIKALDATLIFIDYLTGTKWVTWISNTIGSELQSSSRIRISRAKKLHWSINMRECLHRSTASG
jgi:hypothetical protein